MHEVTLGQFRAFVAATGFRTAAEADGHGASGYDSATRGFVYTSGKYRWHDPGYPQDELDAVAVDRARQRAAVECHGSQAVPGSVLWRRLELLGDVEYVRLLA